MRFVVEHVYERDAEVYVFARRQERGDFTLSASSRLGRASVRPAVTQPRKILADGTPDLDVFAFVLTDRRDMQNFYVGQIVELHP